MGFIALEGVENVRDLGGIPVAGGRVVEGGLFFRGGALAALTVQGAQVLFDQLGVGCVVDLRCQWELDAKPNRVPATVEQLHIPFYDKEKVGIDYTQNAPGTRVYGHDFACEPDHFYRSLANPLTVAQMRRAVQAVFERTCAGRPVYQHCSGGKDRTGILTLLVLTVLGADRQAILEDYLLTNISRDRRYQQNFERFLRLAEGDRERAHELTVSHRARPQNLEAFYGALDERWGGMERFISEQLGIDLAHCEEIRRACTCRA